MIRLDQRPPEHTYPTIRVGLKTHGTFDGRFHGEGKKKVDSGIRSRFDEAAMIADAELSRDLAIPTSILLRRIYNITLSSMHSWRHHNPSPTWSYPNLYPLLSFGSNFCPIS